MGRTPKITTEQILTTARQVFWERGIEASTADIAREAGISEASIFKRFTTKQDLILAAIGIDSMPDWVKTLERGTPDPEFKTQLTTIVQEMLAFYQDTIPRVIMMMSPLALLRFQKFVPPPIRDCRLLTVFLNRAIEAGYIRKCNTMVISNMVVGGINNYAVYNIMNSKYPQTSDRTPQSPPPLENPEPEQFIESLMENLWLLIEPMP